MFSRRILPLMVALVVLFIGLAYFVPGAAFEAEASAPTLAQLQADIDCDEFPGGLAAYQGKTPIQLCAPSPALRADQPNLEEMFPAIYLPFISKPRPVISGYFKLLEPRNGIYLATLAPELKFMIGEDIPFGTQACLAISKTPHPTVCIDGGIFSIYYLDPYTTLTYYSFNLEQNTDYYWRVGAASGFDYDHITDWSEEWKVHTGTSGQFPAAPSLFFPGDESPLIDWRLEWLPVFSANLYYVELHRMDDGNPYGINTLGTWEDETLIDEPSLRSMLNMLGGDEWEWWVKARNGYGWGPASPTWWFHLH